MTSPHIIKYSHFNKLGSADIPWGRLQVRVGEISLKVISNCGVDFSVNASDNNSITVKMNMWNFSCLLQKFYGILSKISRNVKDSKWNFRIRGKPSWQLSRLTIRKSFESRYKASWSTKKSNWIIFSNWWKSSFVFRIIETRRDFSA